MSVEKELETISKQHGGRLHPVDVVEYATDPKTELHSHFTWDDGDAAYQYRLWQARQIIRVTVTTLLRKDGELVACRAYVSLKEDRGQEGYGYRPVVKVLGNATLRGVMLTEALDELRVFQRKYRLLKELTPVFTAIQRVIDAKPATNGRARKKRGALVGA